MLPKHLLVLLINHNNFEKMLCCIVYLLDKATPQCPSQPIPHIYCSWHMTQEEKGHNIFSISQTRSTTLLTSTMIPIKGR